ncbi:MAG: polyprenyl synthetase family protein [Flavobacteriaceae bacterium]
MKAFLPYIALVEDFFKSNLKSQAPHGLYDPITSIMGLGGKRLRPALLMASGELFGAKKEDLIQAAAAIELFHNFTLVHDDIMDEAPLRRGEETIHQKWDLNTGILSGDAMLIKSYQLFESYPPEVQVPLVQLFSKTALEVCEGQQYDVEFESQQNVELEQYIKMISYKTAVLIAAALKMGAIIANATEKEQNQLYAFGLNLGIAFQIQDDYLDAFADPEKFGKQVGGDIVENKKTILVIKALEFASSDQEQELRNLLSTQSADQDQKVATVKQLFVETGSAAFTKSEVERYTKIAFDALSELQIENDKKKVLFDFAQELMVRDL